jgi:hypothetical protein
MGSTWIGNAKRPETRAWRVADVFRRARRYVSGRGPFYPTNEDQALLGRPRGRAVDRTPRGVAFGAAEGLRGMPAARGPIVPTQKDRRAPNRNPPRTGRGSRGAQQGGPGKKIRGEGGAGAQSGSTGHRGKLSPK